MEKNRVIRLSESALKNVISNTLDKVNKKKLSEQEVIQEDMTSWIVGLVAAIPAFMILAKLGLEFYNGVKNDKNLGPEEKKSKMDILSNVFKAAADDIRRSNV